jgi:hypothetical protein
MKTKKIFLGIFAFALITASSCSKESDIELNEHNVTFFSENFNDSTDNTTLNTTGWINFSEVGTRLWLEQTFNGGGYAEFSSFGSGQLVNVGWLISPQIDMDIYEGEKMSFTTAQNFLRSRENSLELFVSTNFDGTNVLAADWINLPIITPGPETERFLAISSGEVDLSKYKGKLNFAFKVRGSGTNSNLTGTYQIDNVNVFYKATNR